MSTFSARAAFGFVLLGACRIGGGPHGDPSAYVDLPEPEGGSAAAPESGAGDDTAGEPSFEGGDDADQGDAPGGDAAADAAPSCAPPSSVPVCDPVKGTGCDALHRCDVDPTQPTPTGRCVFQSSGTDGGACDSSFLDESCPAPLTCAGGACRQPCYCDGDCAAGQCCAADSASVGFLLCQACP